MAKAKEQPKGVDMRPGHLEVRSLAPAGHRRAGLFWPRSLTRVSFADLTREQLKKLRDDVHLQVRVVKDSK